MVNIDEKTADLTGHVEEFAETWYKLTVLNVRQKTANLVSAGLITLIITVTAIFVLLLGSIALSWWLGNLVDSRAGGFLLGAAFFILVMIIIVLLRKKILFPFFRDLIIRKLYE